MSIKSCFVAYPSKPSSLAETIKEAIDKIKQGQVVEIDGWESTAVGGRFIITAICQAIESRDIFICDLTNLNPNVLFELGYAIAKKKRIWILLDPNIEQSKADYEKFKLLTTIGYIPYSNSLEIQKAFYKDQPYNNIENTIYREAIESVIRPTDKSTLLYLKSGIETEASVKLSRRVNRSPIPSIVDDPNEVRIQTLSWYAQNVFNAYAVIVHFLSSKHTEWRFHNAKNSLVSGLAHGFGKHLLMLAHEPYESPIDYRDLLRTHEIAAQCEKLANDWLDILERDYSERTTAFRLYAEEIKAKTLLQNITVGDPVAEHESETLSNYFISTSAYEEALRSTHSIFIGRKGSGKTANFYKLSEDIKKDVRNHVCIIKPVAYELEGVLRMLQQTLPISEKGYLIESFWKFLIYTELARSVFEVLQSKPSYYQLNDAEQKLVDFVKDNYSIITPEFSIRLESIVNALQNIGAMESAQIQRAKISELLHDKVIEKIRSVLGEILEKKEKIAILVDNLDKAWTRRADFPILSELLFGLLRISQVISRDFQKSDHWRKPVNLSLIIFLRSDIFAHIIKYARERDKIPFTRITWEDSELLLRVLEERFIASNVAIVTPSEIWSQYFCTSVKGIPTRQYLTQCILPRPRDLIYLSKAAISQAVNRGHTKVEEEDIVEAEKLYSQYALDSLLVENGIRIESLEELLYEFADALEVIEYQDILQAMNACGIPEERLDDVIELLCDLTFLGMEVTPDRFEFLYNEEQRNKLQVMARKTAESRPDKTRRFRINKPFHSYLEIRPVLGR